MQYNTMKKAEIITMINDKDAQIAELEAALKIANYTIGRYEDLMKNLVATSKDAIANAEKSQKVAEDSQKIAADAINVAKKVTGKKLAAPKPDNTTEKKPTTYKDAINDYKIQKYGNLDTANAVKAMTNVVAKEWAETARKTGKYVVSRKNYKDKLYAEAYLRILIKNKADKKMIEAQRKVVDGLK